jgi:hypothetical protein
MHHRDYSDLSLAPLPFHDGDSGDLSELPGYDLNQIRAIQAVTVRVSPQTSFYSRRVLPQQAALLRVAGFE